MTENSGEPNPIPGNSTNQDNGDFDHEFSIQGKLIQARKSVLASQSPIFRAEFDHPINEITLFDNRSIITDVEFAVFKAFIDYLHVGSCPHIGDFPVELLIVADRYCVEELCQKCELTMFNTLNIYNAPQYLAVAMQLERINPINFTADFIKRTKRLELHAWRLAAENFDIMIGIIHLFFHLKQGTVSESVSRIGFDFEENLTLNRQNSEANQAFLEDSSSTPSSSTADQASTPRSIERQQNLINILDWSPRQVIWIIPRDSPSLVSPLFFVMFPRSSSLCGYNLVFQRHGCIQCRTSFAIALCSVSPKPNCKLMGSIAGKNCTIMNGCGRCSSYSPPFRMRILKSGEAGVDRVEYGRYEGSAQFSFMTTEFTFTLPESSGCQVNPDCRFIVGAERTVFYISSQTLARGSAYFTQLLLANSGSSFILKDECVTPEDFTVIASWLENNRPPEVCEVNQDVLKMAKHFKLSHLFSICDKILAQKVTSTSAVLCFVIGHQIGAPLLKNSAKNYIINNMEMIDDSDWECLRDTSELLLELLMELV